MGRVGRALNSCLRSLLGTLFPKFPVSLRPPDNLCKAKDGHRQRKNDDVDCYLKKLFQYQKVIPDS